ncbi:MAG TPA: SRPBCC domain-containing protein [Chitinophagales bacterium]|nr:SRPBCC domain-containing protein [Chitinophagales bacterium]HNA57625.1 SRPBCC domain-containing protein [Chitinophagales bacterium]HNE44899.1 SRPBCC domain-containing protein [Chitinophagales bacterium]HNI55323.1 SRPBCC domain-containing protein [Chitinophagales bacterium]HNJ90478.1 SRPBCC domain-containing protein [Chitinophagales bacterium]
MTDQKTIVTAPEHRQEIVITRTFDLPVDLLFMAYEDAEIVAQWMNTKVLKLESKQHGSYRFETPDPMGNVHGFNGTIHSFEKNASIVRTFEMENGEFPVQLEYLTFEKLGDDKSKLTMHIVFQSIEARDRLLKLPFAMGINMAHNRIQEIQSTSKQ